MIDFIYLFLTKPRRKIGEDRKRHNGMFTYIKKKKPLKSHWTRNKLNNFFYGYISQEKKRNSRSKSEVPNRQASINVGILYLGFKIKSTCQYFTGSSHRNKIKRHATHQILHALFVSFQTRSPRYLPQTHIYLWTFLSHFLFELIGKESWGGRELHLSTCFLGG
jgi:hypothetical protein